MCLPAHIHTAILGPGPRGNNRSRTPPPAPVGSSFLLVLHHRSELRAAVSAIAGFLVRNSVLRSMEPITSKLHEFCKYNIVVNTIVQRHLNMCSNTMNLSFLGCVGPHSTL